MSGALWRAVDRPVPGYGSGGEQIARAAAAQIMDNLETQCQAQEDLWALRDQDWATMSKGSYKRTKITRVPPNQIYLGMQPSLVSGKNARFDKWPAITVRCGIRNPSSDPEQPDHYDEMDLDLIIEVLASAGPFTVDPLDDRDASDAIDRQYQRLSDAVVACINADRSLGGNVPTIQRPPRMIPSEPFVMKTDRGSGQWMLFQAMEITYVVTSLLY